MKQPKLILCLLVIFNITLAFGQAKKPTLMVVPSDAWCIQNGYFLVFEIPVLFFFLQQHFTMMIIITAMKIAPMRPAHTSAMI